MIIALTGSPGTGKTTVAALLAKELGWTCLSLNTLAEQKQCYCGYDRSRNTKIVDVGKVEKAVLALHENLVIEAHYAHDVENDLTIVLRCEISELKKRLRAKGWNDKKVEENLQVEIFSICLEEARELNRNVVEVDTTGKSPQEVVKIITKNIPL